jgi:hypothetical protein
MRAFAAVLLAIATPAFADTAKTSYKITSYDWHGSTQTARVIGRWRE